MKVEFLLLVLQVWGEKVMEVCGRSCSRFRRYLVPAAVLTVYDLGLTWASTVAGMDHFFVDSLQTRTLSPIWNSDRGVLCLSCCMAPACSSLRLAAAAASWSMGLYEDSRAGMWVRRVRPMNMAAGEKPSALASLFHAMRASTNSSSYLPLTRAKRPFACLTPDSACPLP